MSTMRRFAYAAFGVACLHLVFGAIVRISGSGMGCGPHWPRCYGYWFPPMSRPDLVIEVMHRYLASVLLLSLIALVAAAWRRRAEPGVGGRGGVLRSATLAMTLGFGAALLGAVTVKLANSAPATVAHWTVAMSLIAAVTATVIRAGGLGGTAAREALASPKARRATLIAAAMALVAVVMGGLTAKVQGGPIACLAFPQCGANPLVPRGAVHVQSTHRLIAILLVLHLVGVFFAFRKRGEPAVLRRAATIAMSLGILQLLVAGAMIGMHLPPVLRSLHEATGVSVWIATFALAYLARLGGRGRASGEGAERPTRPAPATSPELDPMAASVRAAGPRAALASALAETIVPAPVALPASPGGALAMAPRPTPVSAMAVMAPADARPIPVPGPALAPEPNRRADEAIELPAALEHASRFASQAALALLALAAAGAEAHVEREAATWGERVAVDAAPVVEAVEVAVAECERPAPPTGEVITPAVPAEHHSAAPVSDRDVAAGEVAPGEGEIVVAAAVGAAAHDVEVARPAPPVGEVSGDSPVAEHHSAAPVTDSVVAVGEVAVVRADEAGDIIVAAADGAMADDVAVADGLAAADVAAAHDVEVARPAPPVGEVSPAEAVAEDRSVARVVRFVAEPGAVEEDDALYNLAGLDEFEDRDDDPVVAEHVPSLDEEFSRLAEWREAEATEPGTAVAAAPVVAAPVAAAPVVAPLTALSSIAALRRPAMTHSVAVIVARGADF